VKVKYAINPAGERDGFLIFCPACGIAHHFPARTSWNRDMAVPSVPALSVTSGGRLCHFQIVGGSITFLPDCTHGLKNKTVPLPDIV
jgi:hypothetical protein